MADASSAPTSAPAPVPAPVPVTHLCGHCGIAAKLVCTRCRGVHYCSATCQKEAWPAHKAKCVAAPVKRSYEVPPDDKRCPDCKGWGLDLLHEEFEGRCEHCWSAKHPEYAKTKSDPATAVE